MTTDHSTEDGFKCDYNTFKQRAKEFFDAADTLDAESLDNAYKALTLSYLHMVGSEIEVYQASIVLQLGVKRYPRLIRN